MTNISLIKKDTSIKKRINLNKLITISVILLTLVISIFYSDEIAHSVKSGLRLCANVIIPSVFPFIILADFLIFAVDFSTLNFVPYLFEKIFKINKSGVYALIIGFLCGFPLGVKTAKELYIAKELSKEETERLIGFCNNTGPAFLVSGIGYGLRGDVSEGVFLYVIMIISALLVGYIFSLKSKPSVSSAQFTKKYFSLTNSIRKAGNNTLTICAYLTFFACFCGILRNILGENLLYLFIIPLLEVGSAASILSKTRLLPEILSLALTAFAICFSGLSVHLQALSFISDTDLKVKKYFAMKLIEGIFSFLLTFLLFPLLRFF